MGGSVRGKRMNPKRLLPKVKANLVLTHDGDDGLLLAHIAAAIDYAQTYQNQAYGRRKPPAAAVQAVIMLATHFYESRDGGTGGFFSANTYAVTQIWTAVNRLLALNKKWEV